MHWRGLYKEIRKVYKKIALETYNSCIKDLLTNKLICKEDVKEKGKRVIYSLTTKGSQRIRLLPRINKTQKITNRLSKKTERLRKAYLLVLLFRGRPEYTIKSKNKFIHFLSTKNLSPKDLVLRNKREENKDGVIRSITVYKQIFDISIWKVETCEILNPEKKTSIYKFSLPGLSITDILHSRNKPVFWHINFTKDEIQDMFSMLRNEGILRPIAANYNNESRYVISDPQLEGFLEGCGHIHHMVYNMNDAIWSRVRKPTDNEIKRSKLLEGAQLADKKLGKTHDERLKFFLLTRNKKQVSKKIKQTIIEYNDEIKEYIADLKAEYNETIKKYQFLCDELLDLIYPQFLQQLSMSTL